MGKLKGIIVFAGCGAEGDCLCPDGQTVATDENGCCYDNCYDKVDSLETGSITFEIEWNVEE